MIPQPYAVSRKLVDEISQCFSSPPPRLTGPYADRDGAAIIGAQFDQHARIAQLVDALSPPIAGSATVEVRVVFQEFVKTVVRELNAQLADAPEHTKLVFARFPILEMATVDRLMETVQAEEKAQEPTNM